MSDTNPTSNLVDEQLPDHGQGAPYTKLPGFVGSAPISRTPTIHELKTWSDVFPGLLDGSKRFESRKYDRDYRVNDILYLREWHRGGEGSYTGRSIALRVTYILFGGRFGIEDGYVVMGVDGVRHADETTEKFDWCPHCQAEFYNPEAFACHMSAHSPEEPSAVCKRCNDLRFVVSTGQIGVPCPECNAEKATAPCSYCFGDKTVSMSDGSKRMCELCGGTGRVEVNGTGDV